MKKIYLAALTLAMTACVSNDDLNPVDNYGYIDVNVSNDPVMVTRATIKVDDLSSWTIKANDYNLNDDNKVPTGTYTITASNYASETSALESNNGWGDAYYYGYSQNVQVSAGGTSEVSINCGSAKNSRLKVEFTLNDNAFSEYSVTTDRNLTFTKENMKDKLAYYNVGENTKVNYTFNYTHANKPTSKSGTINFNEAAKEYKLSIKSNDNGTITITEITYNDSFDPVDGESITFDAATGKEVTE